MAENNKLFNIVFDTNCFIDAVNPDKPTCASLQKIINYKKSGRIIIMVSQHTLEELSKKTPEDEAFKLAKTMEPLPHFPIGTWGDSVTTIPMEQIAGTWDDVKNNEDIQHDIKTLANAGTSIRDRGAYVDAIRASADAFITVYSAQTCHPFRQSCH